MLDPAELLAAPLTLAWDTPRRASPRAPDGEAESVNVERARALASRLPPSVEGHGGDAALFRAANEIATVLGEDREGIATVLREDFNSRCVPPWPDAKIDREAERAAERQASPEARAHRRRETRALASTGLEVDALDDTRETDWTRPFPPISWYCEGLALAPSRGKISIIGGDPGAGKGPFADYLAIHFALGLPLFGSMPVRRCNVGLLDFEGWELTQKRVAAHMRGLRLPTASLQGRLFHRESGPREMADPELSWIREWVEAREIEVLIVDSYTSAVSASGVDPNSPEFAWLASALGELGIVVLAVAHARKPAKGTGVERPTLGDLAGSYALGGYAQTAIGVWKPDPDDPLLTRLGCMRAPDRPFPVLDLRWSRHGEGADLAWRAELLSRHAAEDARRADADARHTAAARRVIAHMWLHPSTPQSPNAVANACGVHHRDVAAILGALARARLASYQPDPRGRTGGAYTLRPGASPPAVSFVAGEVVALGESAGPARRWIGRVK